MPQLELFSIQSCERPVSVFISFIELNCHVSYEHRL